MPSKTVGQKANLPKTPKRARKPRVSVQKRIPTKAKLSVGQKLAKDLDARQLDCDNFAKLCKCSPHLVVAVIEGRTNVRPELQARFDKVLETARIIETSG